MDGKADTGEAIPGTYVFDGARSRRGYRLNRMAMSLTRPENRAAIKADLEAYMERYGLSEDEKRMVRARDWLAMVKYGANIYMILKFGAVWDIGLAAFGAQQRGETLEAFLATRRVRGAT